MPYSNAKPICRYVNASLFTSPEYLALSQDGSARLLLLYLLIHPHGGAFHVPGLYQVGPSTLRESCRMPARSFSRAFAELQEKRIIRIDSVVRLVWMEAALRLIGPPANPNMVKGFCRSIIQMPSCALLEEAIASYGTFLTRLGPSFFKPFAEAFSPGSEIVSSNTEEPNRNGSETVCETYIHSNSYRDNNNHSHINLVREPPGSDYAAENAKTVHRFSERVGWPLSATDIMRSQVSDLPALSENELEQGKALLSGREGIKDRWAYLFAIVRRSRAGHPIRQNAGEVPDDEADPFESFSDGQEVDLHGP
jgi:hypothetical protein